MSTNLFITESTIFRSNSSGSFTIVLLAGPVVDQLQLLIKLQGLHMVFHAFLLHRYMPGGDIIELPVPIIVESEAEYKLKKFF